MLTSSYKGSPVSLLSVPNSIINVPTPAVQVTLVSPGGTPDFKLIVPYGIPVELSNAAMSLWATSSAKRSNGPLQGQPGSSFTPVLSERMFGLISFLGVFVLKHCGMI